MNKARSSYGGETRASVRHPHRNEDRFVIMDDYNVAAVFDGLGGHEGSELAAATAANVVQQTLTRQFDAGSTPHEELLGDALFEAHQEIRRLATTSIGTTAVLAHIINHADSPARTVLLAWCGDSRAYVYSRKNGLRFLTLDHSTVSRVAPNHGIDPWDAQAAFADALDSDYVPFALHEHWRYRNIVTTCLGDIKPPIIDTSREVLEETDDLLVLTTDGIHDNVTTKQMKRILDKGGTQAELVEAAYDIADEEIVRSKHDDMTAVVLPLR